MFPPPIPSVSKRGAARAANAPLFPYVAHNVTSSSSFFLFLSPQRCQADVNAGPKRRKSSSPSSARATKVPKCVTSVLNRVVASVAGEKPYFKKMKKKELRKTKTVVAVGEVLSDACMAVATATALEILHAEKVEKAREEGAAKEANEKRGMSEDGGGVDSMSVDGQDATTSTKQEAGKASAAAPSALNLYNFSKGRAQVAKLMALPLAKHKARKLAQECRQLRQALSRSKRQCQRAEKHSSDLQEKLNRSIASAAAARESALQSAEAASARAKELRSKLAAVRAETGVLNSETRRLRKQLGEKEKEAEAMQKKLKKRKKEIKQLKRDAKGLAERALDVGSEAREMQQALAQLKGTAETEGKRLREQEQEKRERESREAEAAASSSKDNASFRVRCAELTRKLEAAERKLKDATGEGVDGGDGSGGGGGAGGVKLELCKKALVRCLARAVSEGLRPPWGWREVKGSAAVSASASASENAPGGLNGKGSAKARAAKAKARGPNTFRLNVSACASRTAFEAVFAGVGRAPKVRTSDLGRFAGGLI